MKRLSLLIGLLCLLSCQDDKIAPTGFLNITVDQDSLNIESKVPCTITFSLGKNELTKSGKIKKRGGWSIRFPKNNYSLSLEEDLDIFGFGKDDDYIFNASFIDKTFLRNALSYHLLQKFSGKLTSAPLSNFVQIKLNGQKQGLYVVHPRVDKSYLSLDSTGVSFKGPPIFIDPNLREFHSSGNPYHQKYPDLEVADYNQKLEQDFDEIIKSDVCNTKILDKRISYITILSWHIYLLLSDGDDNLLKNFYLFKQKDTDPYDLCHWDCDHSFGRDGDNERKPESDIIDISRNQLIQKLSTCPNYNLDLKNKYFELRDKGIISQKEIYGFIDEKASIISIAVKENNTLWPVDHEAFFDHNNFEEEIEIMKGFISKKIHRLDQHFNYTGSN